MGNEAKLNQKQLIQRHRNNKTSPNQEDRVENLLSKNVSFCSNTTHLDAQNLYAENRVKWIPEFEEAC